MALYYPPVGFHFVVFIEDFSPRGIAGAIHDSSFQEVSGLNVSIEEETFKEGGENRFVHRFPGRVNYEKLSLKRGMLRGSQMIGWFRDAVESFDFKPKDVNVILLNGDHMPLEAWTFIQAYPVKWSISPFNAQSNEIVVETIDLNFQYFRRMDIEGRALSKVKN